MSYEQEQEEQLKILNGEKRMDKKKLTFDEFLERIKNKESVSRFEFDLNFEWNVELSARLRFADLRFADLRSADLHSADLSYTNLRYTNLSYADLHSADLSYADLSYTDLSYANGEFIFNFGVKLKVVK